MSEMLRDVDLFEVCFKVNVWVDFPAGASVLVVMSLLVPCFRHDHQSKNMFRCGAS